MFVWVILGVSVLLIAIFLIGIYNTLVQLRQRVQNAWSQVDVQLKRRYDLIPNLVQTVKGYAQHEKTTLDAVTRARNLAVNAENMQAQMQAENALTGALRSLFAVAEAYPELKADKNFLQLQSELSDMESRIAYSRQFYNDTVQKFNTKIEVFPNNLLAGPFGFAQADYFSLQEEPMAREAVRVEF